jgi:hypothetical protein
MNGTASFNICQVQLSGNCLVAPLLPFPLSEKGINMEGNASWSAGNFLRANSPGVFTFALFRASLLQVRRFLSNRHHSLLLDEASRLTRERFDGYNRTRSSPFLTDGVVVVCRQ